MSSFGAGLILALLGISSRWGLLLYSDSDGNGRFSSFVRFFISDLAGRPIFGILCSVCLDLGFILS